MSALKDSTSPKVLHDCLKSRVGDRWVRLAHEIRDESSFVTDRRLKSESSKSKATKALESIVTTGIRVSVWIIKFKGSPD